MKLVLATLFLCFSFFVQGQLVSGFIQTEQNAAVPFASVYLSSSSNGSVANSKGYYQIEIESLKDTIVFSAIGFQEKKVAVQSIENNSLNVKLKVQAIEIGAVEVGGENNFAEVVIKNAIKHRKEHLQAIQSFKAKAYTKVSLEEDNIFAANQKSGLNFIENYVELYYEYPNKWKVEKLAVKDLSKKKNNKNNWGRIMGGPNRRAHRRQATNPNIFFSNFSDGNFNFYENFISVPKLGETPFISPIGNLAMISYDYKFEKSFYEGEQLIHKILVSPKRSQDALFSGMIYINAGTWDIAALELSVPKIAMHYFTEFKIYQHYVAIDSIKVLNRQELFYKVKRGGTNLHGTVYSNFDNYQLNLEHPKGTFSNAIRITVDSAYTRNVAYWDSVRAVPLKENEQEFVERIDSINKRESSPEFIKHQEKIKNKVTFLDVTFGGIDHYNSEKGLKWVLDPLSKQVKFAGVGGYRHAIGGRLIKTFPSKHELDLFAQADYGFGNNDLLSNGSVSFTYFPKKFAKLKIAGGAKYQMLTYWQNIATIFSRSNYVRNDFISVSHSHELFNGFFLDVRAKYMQRTSIDQLDMAGWSDDLFGDDNTPREFDPYNELNIKIEAAYTPFQKYALEPNSKVILGSKWPTFIAKWEQGVPGVFNSKIHYQLIKLGVTQDVKLSVFGTAKYGVWAGKYIHTSNVEYPNMTFFRGTDNYFFSHPIYTFQLLGETYTALDEYVEMHYIHHFNGMFIKKVPYLNRTKLQSVAGAGALYINEGNFQHSEVFAGLEFPFKLWDTKLKIGAYYAVAYSNYSELRNMVKFGLNVYNPFTNEWAY